MIIDIFNYKVYDLGDIEETNNFTIFQNFAQNDEIPSERYSSFLVIKDINLSICYISYDQLTESRTLINRIIIPLM